MRLRSLVFSRLRLFKFQVVYVALNMKGPFCNSKVKTNDITTTLAQPVKNIVRSEKGQVQK